MFIANFIVLFNSNPPLFLNHARPERMLPLDLVAPLFGFAMGLCLPFTRARTYPHLAWTRVVRRVLLLLLIGYLPNSFYYFSLGGSLRSVWTTTWGILGTFAFTYLAGFLSLKFRLAYRLLLTLGLALAYQIIFLYSPSVSRWVLSFPEGGPLATLSWSVTTITGTVLGELLMDRRKKTLIWGIAIGLGFLFVGVLLHTTLAPMNRLAASASFVIFGTGIATLSFLLLYFLQPPWAKLFRAAGKYPLQAWLLQGTVYIPLYSTVGEAYFAWPLGGWLAALVAAALFATASWLGKAGLRLRA